MGSPNFGPKWEEALNKTHELQMHMRDLNATAQELVLSHTQPIRPPSARRKVIPLITPEPYATLSRLTSGLEKISVDAYLTFYELAEKAVRQEVNIHEVPRGE
ncbi:MAG: hypothetical protein ACREGG_01205 [Candidatus Saccharimonadales bacterium]